MKILDTEFRKGLYKNLMDAGYDKAEAQKIVGVKYFNALKEKLNNTINVLVEKVSTEQFDFTIDENWIAEFNSDMAEAQKMKEIVQ